MLFGVVHPAIMALLGAKYLFELETGKPMFEKGKLLAGVKKVWHLHKTYIFGVAAGETFLSRKPKRTFFNTQDFFAVFSSPGHCDGCPALPPGT